MDVRPVAAQAVATPPALDDVELGRMKAEADEMSPPFDGPRLKVMMERLVACHMALQTESPVDQAKVLRVVMLMLQVQSLLTLAQAQAPAQAQAQARQDGVLHGGAADLLDWDAVTQDGGEPPSPTPSHQSTASLLAAGNLYLSLSKIFVTDGAGHEGLTVAELLHRVSSGIDRLCACVESNAVKHRGTQKRRGAAAAPAK